MSDLEGTVDRRLDPVVRRRLKRAGLLSCMGLAIEATTILWSHPVAFVAFIVFGGLLVAAGVLTYLWALFS